jgi:nitroreductase
MTADNVARKADHPVSDVFVERWSPRAFASDTISDTELRSVLEAARWAPSAYNAQPWRFIYALRGDAAWSSILGALMPFNQSWAQNAAAIIVIASDTKMTPPGKTERVDNGTHAFDVGAAWGYLALQAHMNGWATHAMAGFDKEAMAKAVSLPAEMTLHAVVALGKQGDVASLPEALQAREVPSPRRPLSETVVHGSFKG